jgi:hypothetical protein
VPSPKNKHEFGSFLGLCTYFRLFISGISNIAKQLTQLTERKQSFQWTPEVEDTFQSLKGALCADPNLAFPQPGENFILDTDGSKFLTGGVLSQVQDGEERVSTYYSKTLRSRQFLPDENYLQ